VVVGEVAADNFPQDKTIRVFLEVQEPLKAVLAKAKVAAMVLVAEAVVVAKMAVQVA
jgi:hypothetical protein